MLLDSQLIIISNSDPNIFGYISNTWSQLIDSQRLKICNKWINDKDHFINIRKNINHNK